LSPAIPLWLQEIVACCHLNETSILLSLIKSSTPSPNLSITFQLKHKLKFQNSIRASPMELEFSFIAEFCCSTKRVCWTIRPTHFEKSPMHVQVSDLDTWNIIIINPAQTLASFTICLDRFWKMPMSGRSIFYLFSINPIQWSLQHSTHCCSTTTFYWLNFQVHSKTQKTQNFHMLT
jgi:hypothetical protein